MPKSNATRAGPSTARAHGTKPSKAFSDNSHVDEDEREDQAFSDSDKEEDSKGLDFEAMLKFVQANKTKKETARHTTLAKKIANVVDKARLEIDEMAKGLKEVAEHAQQELKRLQEEDDAEVEWVAIASQFGERTTCLNKQLEAYEVMLGEQGPNRIAEFEQTINFLDINPAMRAKSRKRLRKTAQQHMEKNVQAQKEATDAEELIKHYQALIRC